MKSNKLMTKKWPTINLTLSLGIIILFCLQQIILPYIATGLYSVMHIMTTGFSASISALVAYSTHKALNKTLHNIEMDVESEKSDVIFIGFSRVFPIVPAYLFLSISSWFFIHYLIMTIFFIIVVILHTFFSMQITNSLFKYIKNNAKINSSKKWPGLIQTDADFPDNADYITKNSILKLLFLTSLFLLFYLSSESLNAISYDIESGVPINYIGSFGVAIIFSALPFYMSIVLYKTSKEGPQIYIKQIKWIMVAQVIYFFVLSPSFSGLTYDNITENVFILPYTLLGVAAQFINASLFTANMYYYARRELQQVDKAPSKEFQNGNIE